MAFDDYIPATDDDDEEEQRRQAAAARSVISARAEAAARRARINAQPRGTSFLPDGTPITDDDLQDNLAGIARPGGTGDTSPDQFGLKPLPPPKQIGPAPGVASVPAASPPVAAPAGYTPAPPPGFLPNDQSGSGYGDAIRSIGALGASLYKMGLPGMRDHGGDLDPITQLPAQLQREHMNARYMAQLQAGPIQAQIANLPPDLQGAAMIAAQKGDARTLANIMNVAAGRTGRAGAHGVGANVGPNGEKAPAGYHFVDGQLTYIPGGPKDPANAKAEKLTQDQANSGLYADRMAASGKTLRDLESEGLSLWNKTADNVPIVGNYAKSDKAQQFNQAERDFINATLRRESGAAIAESEFANARQQYIPQPGDSAAVLAQKAQNRRIATHGIARAGGHEYYENYVAKYGKPDDSGAPAQSGQNTPGNRAPTQADYEAEMRRRGFIK